MSDITREGLKKVVLQANSLSDICRALGISINKRGIGIVREMLDRFELNTAHFDKSKWHRRKYPKEERTCPVCEETFEVSAGSKKKNKKYCSQKCANSLGLKKKERKKCLVCDNKVKSSRKEVKFCSPQCNGRYHQLKTFEKIKNGTFKVTSAGNRKNYHLKLYLIEKHGHKCMGEGCGRSEWLGKPIPLQLDHIDGDSENDKEENIRNLCPNCHAQTPTYCGKNKGKGKRKHRLKDYRKGKKKW